MGWISIEINLDVDSQARSEFLGRSDREVPRGFLVGWRF